MSTRMTSQTLPEVSCRSANGPSRYPTALAPMPVTAAVLFDAVGLISVSERSDVQPCNVAGHLHIHYREAAVRQRRLLAACSLEAVGAIVTLPTRCGLHPTQVTARKQPL